MHERDIFLAVLEIADPAERSAYIEQACGSNSTLRAQVEELLRTHAETSQFLETRAAVLDSEVAQTVITDSTAGDKSDADDDDPRSERMSGEAEFRKYLQPATRAGWLGRLAHYEIEQILGRGAFGIVAKAFDEKLHRVVAIKLMNPELASTSPPRKRFLREARTAAAVTHENIVAIYAVEEEPIPYLVMEYVPGQTLQQRMDEHGPFEVADVLRIGQQVAAGMAAAHAMKLIHRDIKPANILLTGGINERAKISDFGLARAVDDATMTSSGLIAGTPMYMAPEQARGEVLDHRADLFSLGSVLYQMVSGRPPFRAANTVAVLKRVCEDTPRPLEDVIPGTPVWLGNIISKLMEKDREERYQSAQELADLFARCLNELQLNGYVSIAGEASRLSETRRIEPLPAKTPQVSNQWRERFFVAYVVGLTLVVVSAAVWVWFNRQPPAQPRTAEAAGSVSQPAQIPDKPTATTGWHGWPADAPKPAIAPFDAAQAKKHQEEWATYLKVPVEYTNSIGMKFRLIPPGEFTMGSTAEEIAAALKDVSEDKHWQECIKSEAPQHTVILTQPIYLVVSEVTQAEYEKIMGMNPSHFALTGAGKEAVTGLDTAKHPVEMVSWNDAAEFCAKLSQQEKLKPFYFRAGDTITPLDGTGYRLTSEAEWEFACRAGTATKYWIGEKDEELVRAGWLGENSGGRTHAAGELKANPFGLFDMHGNVWEWVQDGWDASYYGQFTEKHTTNPSSPFSVGSRRVIRGGGWGFTASACRSSVRFAHHPTPRPNYIGFRVSLPVEAVQQALKSTGPAMQGELAAPPQSSPLQTPRTGPALAFTKTEDRVDVPAVPIDLSKPWTFEAWAEITDLRNVISQSVATLGPVRLKLYFDKAWEVELSQFIVGGPYTRGAALRDSAYVPGRVHVASQWTGTQLQLFVNGRPVTTSPHTFRTETAPVEIIRELLKPTQSVQLQIGNYAAERLWPGAGNSLGGNVDSLRISTGNMYAGPFVPGPLSKTADTIALYDFSQGNGGVLRDISGNGHDGKIIGATWVQSREGSNTVTGWHGWPAEAPKPAIAPFDAAQAKQHQAEWAAYLKVPVEYENSIGMKFRLIPPGEFLMGSTPEEIQQVLQQISGLNLTPADMEHLQEDIKSEGPQHTVILTQPIYLGVNEVTQTEYENVMGGNPSHFSKRGPGKDAVAGMDTARHPVEMVSWIEAAEFTAKLSHKEALKPFYLRTGEKITAFDGTGYRLLTEAEWEYACRAGTVTRFGSGNTDEDLMREGWFDGNSGGRTHAVGELAANSFGLYDIHGNVMEWVQDGWDPLWYGQHQKQPAENPQASFAEGYLRVIRGGDWIDPPSLCRSGLRRSHAEANRNFAVGFRVTLTVDAVKQALKAQAASKPAPEAAETLAEYYARNRRAAEKVLAVGGEQSNVTIEITQPFEWRTVSPGQTLPDVPFLVRSWSVKNAQVVTNDDLDVLAGLRHVLSLNLTAQGGLDAACVAKIASLQSPLNDLGIGHIQLKTSDLGQLPIMPHVDLIWLSSEQIDDDWKFLNRFPSLRHLMLYGAPLPDLRPLGNVPHLRRVHLTAWGEAPDGAQIADIQTRNPNLRILFEAENKLTVLGKDPAFSAARRLVESGIPVSYYDAAGAQQSLALDSEQPQTGAYLVYSIPRGLALTDELRGLLTHVTLQNLTAEGLTDADALASVLRNRQDMEILNLMDSDLTDAGLLQLQRLAGMRSLNIRGTKVTAEGIAAFHRAVPGCHLQTDSGDIPVDYLAIPQPSVTKSGLEFDGAQSFIEIPRLATRNHRQITARQSSRATTLGSGPLHRGL